MFSVKVASHVHRWNGNGVPAAVVVVPVVVQGLTARAIQSLGYSHGWMSPPRGLGWRWAADSKM